MPRNARHEPFQVVPDKKGKGVSNGASDPTKASRDIKPSPMEEDSDDSSDDSDEDESDSDDSDSDSSSSSSEGSDEEDVSRVIPSVRGIPSRMTRPFFSSG